MNPWQLQYVAAGGALQTVTFPQLAALEGARAVGSGWKVEFTSQKSSTVQLNLPGVPAHIAPAIPFESRVKIFSPDGTKQFEGYRTDRNGVSDPHKSHCQYTFEDEWYFLDRCAFYQTWNRVTNSTSNPPTSTTFPFTNIVLFQGNPGQNYNPEPVQNHISTGQQLADILNWAILMGANLQVGQIDPSLYCAFYPVQNVKCGEAIRHCLRLHPDCFTEIDYSTTPPTFNVRQRLNLTPITLPYAYTDASGRRHLVTDIQERPELQPKRVALFYRVISQGNLLSAPMDIWPNQPLSCTGPISAGQLVGGAAAPYTAGGLPIVGTAMANLNAGTANILVGAPPGLRALDFAVDLVGPRSSISQATITSLVFNPTNLNWWVAKVPSLGQNIPAAGPGALALLSNNINTGAAQGITVVDSTGAPMDLTVFQYELDPKSSVMSWMTTPAGAAAQVKEVTVTAYFSYAKSKTIGTGSVTIQQPNAHPHSVRVKLTNLPSGTQSFSQYLTTGEAVPAGLAQNLYNALNWLQYSFTHTFIERPFNGWLKPGKHAINLTGPNAQAKWATMAATVQKTSYAMKLDGAGNTFDNVSVECGPVKHLEAGELIQLFNVFQNRDLSKIDTNERLTGTPSPGQTTAMPSDTAQENSVPGHTDDALKVFSAPDTTNPVTGGSTILVQVNPASGQTSVQQVSSVDATVKNTGIVAPAYSGSGAPAAGTLMAGTYYRQFDRYIDMSTPSAPMEYICITAGTYNVGNTGGSVWAGLGGGLGCDNEGNVV